MELKANTPEHITDSDNRGLLFNLPQPVHY